MNPPGQLEDRVKGPFRRRVRRWSREDGVEGRIIGSTNDEGFTAWVIGPTAQSNRDSIVAIIKNALDWERRSGATFNIQKTGIIHFTRKTYKTDTQPFMIKGQTIEPQDHVKILGVVMDATLKYKEHIWRVASRGLEAAMELRHLQGLSPSTARHCLHPQSSRWWTTPPMCLPGPFF
jgi:hypothetical protein